MAPCARVAAVPALTPESAPNVIPAVTAELRTTALALLVVRISGAMDDEHGCPGCTAAA